MRPQAGQRVGRGFNLSTFDALKHRDFRLLWGAQLGSNFAIQAEMLTRSWLILEMTGSGIVLAAVHVTRALGSMAVTPIAGVLADRLDRRVLLTIGSAVNAFFFAVVGVLVLLDLVEVWHVVLSSLIAGAGQSLTQASSQAIVPRLVPREGIMNAVSLSSVTMGADRIIGPAIAGFTIAGVGVHGAYFISAGVLALPIVLYQLMRPVRVVGGSGRESFLASFRSGLSFALHNPAVRIVLLVTVTTMTLGMPFMQLMPLYVKQVLNAGPDTLGIIVSLPGFLTLGGGIVAASLGDFRYKGPLMFMAVLSPCVATIILSQTSMVWTAILANSVFGAFSSQYGPTSQSSIMKATPDEFRGRVASLMALGMGLSSVGVMLYGVVADLWGIQSTYLLFGAICMVLLAGYFVTIRDFRQLS